MKLGKKTAQFSDTAPKLGSLLFGDNISPVYDLYKKINYWPMLMNDQVGNCTIAGCGHVIEFMKVVFENNLPTMTDLEALVQYEIIGGYKLGDASTDQGCVELNVLQYFEDHGIMAGSQKINLTKFISVDQNSIQEVKKSVFHLGNCYLGLTLPSNAMQTKLWTIDSTATIEGGHCVNVVGYDDNQSLLYIVSWGTVIPMTYDFFAKYTEESWSLFSNEWKTHA
jgi:hypothetical protein